MPIQIGVDAHDFSEPIGLLSDCHRRIEMFLDSLEAAGRLLDNPPTDETKRVLASALRYFREAAPKHTADEEESLFPRLRDVHGPDVQLALQELAQLENEHQLAKHLHAEIEQLGQQYLSEGPLSSTEARDFASVVTRLRAMYRQHITVEEKLVFPIAARVLTPSDQQTIGKEMLKRRGLKSALGITELYQPK
jgi:hemerythrin-like domain-containing protein